MDIKTFKQVAKTFSPAIAIRVRGSHGIGKSQSIYQLATELRSDFYKDETNQKKYGWSYEQGMPVVERRLSQLTEGDLIGLPVLENGKTVFRPLDWIIDACERPVVLFLDELNRAIDQVKQMFFQMADSRKFYGFTLHPETRLIVAENIGGSYQVQMNDPAEISRYAIIDLEPDANEWFDWALTNLHPATVDYMRSNPQALDSDMKNHQENRKTPDRRAWSRLDRELVASGLMDEPESALFFPMALAMVGSEFANSFKEFCCNREKQISAKEILTDWAKAKSRLQEKVAGTRGPGEVRQEKYIEAVGKLGDWLKKNELAKGSTEVQNLAAFLKDCPADCVMAVYAELSENPNNLKNSISAIRDRVVSVANAASAQPEAEKAAEAETKVEPEVKPAAPAKTTKKAAAKK